MTTIEQDIKTEVEHICLRFSQCIKELSEHYKNTLSDISGKVTEYEAKIHEHLVKTGSDFSF